MKNVTQEYVRDIYPPDKKLLHYAYVGYCKDGWLSDDNILRRYAEIYMRKEGLSCAMFPFVVQQIMFEIYKEYYECHI